MPTTRSNTGDRSPSERKHVGLTLPRQVKARVIASADALAWSAGDWVLAVAAEHGPRLLEALGHVRVRRRPAVEDAAFTALYLTPEEREELDDQAVACGLNRSAFVTAVARLGLGEDLEVVVASLREVGGGDAAVDGAAGVGSVAPEASAAAGAAADGSDVDEG